MPVHLFGRNASLARSPRHPRLRRLLVGLPLGLLLALAPPSPADAPATAAPDGALWDWPIAAPRIVLRGYEAPAHRYGAGHRGIDLEASVGTLVHSPDDGVVSFAGMVVDRPVLSIRHADGLVSSMEPVDALVTAGERVERGQRVGMLSNRGEHCAGCLHLGARKDGEYLSPLALLGGIPRAVLLPLD